MTPAAKSCVWLVTTMARFAKIVIAALRTGVDEAPALRKCNALPTSEAEVRDGSGEGSRCSVDVRMVYIPSERYRKPTMESMAPAAATIWEVLSRWPERLFNAINAVSRTPTERDLSRRIRGDTAPADIILAFVAGSSGKMLHSADAADRCAASEWDLNKRTRGAMAPAAAMLAR